MTSRFHHQYWNEEAVEISVHCLSPYVTRNLKRILPDCGHAPQELRVGIVLQRSRLPLLQATPATQQEKDRLRERFLRLSEQIVVPLRSQGEFIEVIDPRTGYPLFSKAGSCMHDDTAVVQALLNFPVITDACSVLVHPRWGMAVYPGILITSAPAKMQAIWEQVVQQQSAAN